MGLDPESPESCPRLKAGAKPRNHPGIPKFRIVLKWLLLSKIPLANISFTAENEAKGMATEPQTYAFETQL